MLNYPAGYSAKTMWRRMAVTGCLGVGGGSPETSRHEKKKKRNEPENEMSIEVFDTARSFS